MFQLAIERQIELAQQLLRARVVPCWIKRFQICEKKTDRHPLRHFLVLRHIADLLKLPWRESSRIDPQSLRAPCRRLVNVHEDLDRGRLSRAVGPDQREYAALGSLQIQAVERDSAAE